MRGGNAELRLKRTMVVSSSHTCLFVSHTLCKGVMCDVSSSYVATLGGSGDYVCELNVIR